MTTFCTDLHFLVDEQNPFSTIEHCENMMKLLSSIELSSGGQLCEQAEAAYSMLQNQVASALSHAREQLICRERELENKLAEINDCAV